MSSEYKRFYRSTSDRMIAGVGAGVGEYFGIDPTVVRLAFVAGFFLNPPAAVLTYLIMMVVVPATP